MLDMYEKEFIKDVKHQTVDEKAKDVKQQEKNNEKKQEQIKQK